MQAPQTQGEAVKEFLKVSSVIVLAVAIGVLASVGAALLYHFSHVLWGAT